jgi:hypothetical protein
VEGPTVMPGAFRASKSVPSQVSENVRAKRSSGTHIIPNDAMSRVLWRDGKRLRW